MLRRCTASLAILSAAFSMASGPAPALAASIKSEVTINAAGQMVPEGTPGSFDYTVPKGTPGSTMYAYYSLANTLKSAINDVVVVGVVPSGSVVPGGVNNSPLTVVGGSSGFNTSYLGGLGSGPGVVPQGVGLDFSDEQGYKPPYNNPLAPGGVVNFKLSLDPSYTLTTPPTLTLQDPYTSLTLTPYTPAYADAAPGASLNTPEPVSLALWSALVGAGMIRARAFRRARRRA